MVKVVEELMYIQNKSTFLHNYKAIHFKLLLLTLTITSRFVNVYVIFVLLAINTILLLYIGIRRTLAIVFIVWCVLALVITAINILTSTLSISVILNLIYGFTTFTSLTLFYTTTPPKHLRTLIGFNFISLTYLFLGYSIKLVSDLVDVLKARGWEPKLRLSNQKYLLRSFTALLIARISEVEEALKARGVEG